MKSLRRMIAVAAVGFIMPAQAGIADPEVIIYRVSGVVDDAGGNARATSIHCTNFSGVDENIRFVVRGPNAALLANGVFTVPHLNTVTVSTKDTPQYLDFALNTGPVQQGTAAIAATSINVTCTAMQVQPASIPEGIALHMTRFSPIANTQE
jgi:hypothetical protein